MPLALIYIGKAFLAKTTQKVTLVTILVAPNTIRSYKQYYSGHSAQGEGDATSFGQKSFVQHVSSSKHRNQ